MPRFTSHSQLTTAPRAAHALSSAVSASRESPSAQHVVAGYFAAVSRKRAMFGPTSGYASSTCAAPREQVSAISEMVAHLKRVMPRSICMSISSAILWDFTCGHNRAAPPAMSMARRVFSRMMSG